MNAQSKDLHPLLDDVRFNGADYVPERDNARLTGQLLRVWNVVSNGGWHTLKEISQKTGDPEASVSAQLRHLRKDRFGGYTVERKHIQMGLYKYRVVLNGPKAAEESQ